MTFNHFYRLIDRQPTRARVTYYFDDDRRITGMLYEGLTPYHLRPPDRLSDFKLWAAEKYPGLLESWDMRIPNQPKRWRELLVEWRAEVSLPPTRSRLTERLGSPSSHSTSAHGGRRF